MYHRGWCWFIILCCALLSHYVCSIELHASCGFPGKPYRAKINPEEKMIYEDGDTVTYQCADYWAPPQTRKCVNGVWIGPPARCGDFVRDILMKDAQCLDVSLGLPREVFHYTNMNITDRNWKYPNAFTSNRFKAGRLRIVDDHEYLWRFNFTKPVVKLYVKTNVNFINFTLQSETIKNNFSFQITMEVSPYRTCRMEHQTSNSWRENGNRVDSYFICEANSYKDLQHDLANPSNYMVMRTKASHIITYELIGVFFGRAYGNETDPLCGEPELEPSQSFRANQEYKDYMIDCVNKETWIDVTPSEHKKFFYSMRCIGDMFWNGSHPRCIPSKSCSLDSIFERTNHTSGQNETDHKEALVVDSILKSYNFVDNQTIYATVGTELVYTCATVDYILVGKDIRTCRRDFNWSNPEPLCKFIKSSNELIESSNYLLIVIACMGAILVVVLIASCVLAVFCTRQLRLSKRQAELEREQSARGWNENYYDNIEMHNQHHTKGEDGYYDIYEPISTTHEDYTRYTDPSFYVYANEGVVIHNHEQNDDDYLHMFASTQHEQHLKHHHLNQSNVGALAVQVQHELFQRREPSYLEVTND